MSEGSRLRRAIYARMEEISFRSGLAIFAAVLAVTATGIALTVTLGGGHQAAASPPAPSTSARFSGSVPPPSSAQAVPSPSVGSSPAAQSSPVYGSGPSETGAPGTTTHAPPARPSSAPSSPWPTYRRMSLGPSHSLTSPATAPPPPSTPPGWVPP